MQIRSLMTPIAAALALLACQSTELVAINENGAGQENFVLAPQNQSQVSGMSSAAILDSYEQSMQDNMGAAGSQLQPMMAELSGYLESNSVTVEPVEVVAIAQRSAVKMAVAQASSASGLITTPLSYDEASNTATFAYDVNAFCDYDDVTCLNLYGQMSIEIQAINHDAGIATMKFADTPVVSTGYQPGVVSHLVDLEGFDKMIDESLSYVLGGNAQLESINLDGKLSSRLETTEQAMNLDIWINEPIEFGAPNAKVVIAQTDALLSVDASVPTGLVNVDFKLPAINGDFSLDGEQAQLSFAGAKGSFNYSQDLNQLKVLDLETLGNGFSFIADNFEFNFSLKNASALFDFNLGRILVQDDLALENSIAMAYTTRIHGLDDEYSEMSIYKYMRHSTALDIEKDSVIAIDSDGDLLVANGKVTTSMSEQVLESCTSYDNGTPECTGTQAIELTSQEYVAGDYLTNQIVIGETVTPVTVTPVIVTQQ